MYLINEEVHEVTNLRTTKRDPRNMSALGRRWQRSSSDAAAASATPGE